MKKFEYDPSSEAGKRASVNARRAAKIVYDVNGMDAFKIVSTPEKAVAVGLLALADGQPTIYIARGLQEWVDGHPVATNKLLAN